MGGAYKKKSVRCCPSKVLVNFLVSVFGVPGKLALLVEWQGKLFQLASSIQLYSSVGRIQVSYTIRFGLYGIYTTLGLRHSVGMRS